MSSIPSGKGAQPVIVKAFSNIDQDHVATSWIVCASRKLPNGDVLIGHRSAQASHLGNISYMQKRRIDFDPVREEILPLLDRCYTGIKFCSAIYIIGEIHDFFNTTASGHGRSSSTTICIPFLA